MHTQGGAHTPKHTHSLFLAHWWLWAQFRKLELGFEKNSRFNVRKTVVCSLPCWRPFSRRGVPFEEIHLEAFCGAQRTHVKTWRFTLLFPAFQCVYVHAHNSISEGIGDIPPWIFNMQTKLTQKNVYFLPLCALFYKEAVENGLCIMCAVSNFCVMFLFSDLERLATGQNNKTTNSWSVLSKKVSF